MFDDPSYVNVQNLEKVRQASPGAMSNGSVQRDLFDMSEWGGDGSVALSLGQGELWAPASSYL